MIKNKKIKYSVIGLVGILVVVGLLIALNSPQILRALNISSTPAVFIFNESKAPGWWSAENYNSQASTKNYEGSEPIDKLSVASMNVFKGKKGEFKTACFVMFSYYDYAVDVAQLKKNKDSESLSSGSMKNVGESTLSFDVFNTPKDFTLTKYELTGPDAENAMKGMSYGWVNTGSGHISVSGVCPTAGELDDTVQVIGAMSLSEK